MEEELSALREKTRRKLYELGPRAVERLGTVMEVGEPKDMQAAAASVLDRIGFLPKNAGISASSARKISESAVLGALMGLGKMLGAKNSEALRNVTPSEDFIDSEELAVKKETAETPPISLPFSPEQPPQFTQEGFESPPKKKKTKKSGRTSRSN